MTGVPVLVVEDNAVNTKLIAFLQANRNGESYLLATSTTQVAAPIIISTGESV